ncbi:MAG TPA: 16S rRNA (uracil(1498)-N(3))-methyltransferase, partial [Clostridiales bacterium]|nr:16S rRNA (uracil(1498)-N(3))-methyltransferase [Clostridiales bacterium]
MPRFFMAGTNIKGGMAIIRGRDAEHVRVLRLRPGEDLIICDAQGTDYKCRLVSADPEQVEAEVLEVVPCPAEPSVAVTVLCGLPKGDRTDYIIQKCVEAGASEIAFFNCERCVARPETPEKKLERWQRIAEEAAKQSGRGIIPSVSWAGEFADALNIANQKELKLFLYETGEREGLDAVLEANKTA